MMLLTYLAKCNHGIDKKSALSLAHQPCVLGYGMRLRHKFRFWNMKLLSRIQPMKRKKPCVKESTVTKHSHHSHRVLICCPSKSYPQLELAHSRRGNNERLNLNFQAVHLRTKTRLIFEDALAYHEAIDYFIL